MNASASLKSYTSIILVIFCALLFPTQISSSYAFVSDYRITAAGDWSCSADAINILNKMNQLNPRVVLALGDLSYVKTADYWFNETSSIDSKIKILIGNHEQDEGNPPSLLTQYLTHYHVASSYYSFDQKYPFYDDEF